MKTTQSLPSEKQWLLIRSLSKSFGQTQRLIAHTSENQSGRVLVLGSIQHQGQRGLRKVEAALRAGLKTANKLLRRRFEEWLASELAGDIVYGSRNFGVLSKAILDLFDHSLHTCRDGDIRRDAKRRATLICDVARDRIQRGLRSREKNDWIGLGKPSSNCGPSSGAYARDDGDRDGHNEQLAWVPQQEWGCFICPQPPNEVIMGTAAPKASLRLIRKFD